MQEIDLKTDRAEDSESVPYSTDIMAGALKLEDDVNFVFRASESVTNFLRSDEKMIRKVFGCGSNDVVAISIRTSPDTESKISRALLEPDNETSVSFVFEVGYDSLIQKRPQVSKIKNTNIPIYDSQIGWICRKSDFKSVKEILENYRLTPSSYNLDSLNKVFWTDKTASLKRDVEFFSLSKSWFDKRDLPYSRSYLLYGPPGNGKTSAIRAISDYFHTTPSSFSFTAKYDDPDSEFLNWVLGHNSSEYDDDEYDGPRIPRYRRSLSSDENRNPRIRVLLLEDIDRFFMKDSGVNLPISFSTVLNALDGVVQRKNSILIATANNPEKIDSQVLCRPGRFDLRIPFDSPTETLMFDFIKKLTTDDNVSDNVIKNISSLCKGHSFSFAKGVYLSAANRAFSRASSIIDDQDLLSSAEEFASNLGKDIKSIRNGTGF